MLRATIFVAALLLASLARAETPRPMDGKYVVLAGKDIQLLAPSTPRPPYPAGYRIRRYEAAMRLRIYVGENGKIEDVKVRKFYGDTILGSYAIRIAKETFKFRPLLLKGIPTPACFDLPIVFYISMGQGPVSSLVYRRVKAEQIIDLYGK